MFKITDKLDNLLHFLFKTDNSLLLWKEQIFYLCRTENSFSHFFLSFACTFAEFTFQLPLRGNKVLEAALLILQIKYLKAREAVHPPPGHKEKGSALEPELHPDTQLPQHLWTMPHCLFASVLQRHNMTIPVRGLALVYMYKAKDTHLFSFLFTNLNMVKDLHGR